MRSLFIHPATQQQHAAAYDAAIADLQYGTIAVNCPATAAFCVTAIPWGAFPGAPASLLSCVACTHSTPRPVTADALVGARPAHTPQRRRHTVSR
jgi:hypothetical protein